MTVLLVVPRQQRDLEGHTLVAYHLERRHGMKVILSSGVNLEREVLERAPEAVVVDYLGWDTQARAAGLAKSLGSLVFVLPTAGLYHDDDEYARAAGKYLRVSELIDGYLAWGRFSREAILRSGVLREEQIHVVGCPRFDFYSVPYANGTTSREAVLGGLGIRNVGGPVITWCTNTNNFNPHASGLRYVISRSVLHARRTVGEMRRFLRDEATQFQEHSRVVRELAERHPDWNVVIKVHPLERVDPYRRLARRVPNVHVATRMSIRELLRHTDVLLQRGCTTATEAWMLRRPVLELAIGRFEGEWAPVEHRAGSHVVTSVEEADVAIAGYLRGASVPEPQQRARAQYLENCYDRLDGRSAERCAAVIAEAVEAAAFGPTNRVERMTAARQALAHWDRAAGTQWGRLKEFIGVPREQSLRFWQRAFWRSTNSPEILQRDRVRDLYAGYDRMLPRQNARDSLPTHDEGGS